MRADRDRAAEVIAAWQVELPEVLHPTSELTKRVLLLAAELQEATRRELPRYGLTPAQFDVLAALLRSGAPYQVKPSELSRSLLLSSGGTTNVLNHLHRQGMVERLPDPEDGRSTLIRLTPAGAALARDAVRATAAAHVELWAGASAEVVETATGALREVSRPVEAARRYRG
ncbi:MarR family transcriptional regulator [Streptomyces albus subsp. albus]|nr:MarR family transcriptional regulator [Streptomyces albus subsp. albus]